MPLTRRPILASLLAGPFLGLARAAARTPSAAEGPFYPTPAMRFQDIDNNLVRITGAVRDAGGEVVILKGRVLDAERRPVSGARVEIWQCDVNGIYMHTRNRTADYDDAFQGFGHFTTGEDGAYAFRTIRPAVYPGRTPHIHVKVFADGREFTTQFYLDGHPLNDRDWLYQRMSAEEREAVTMRFDDSAEPEASVDILL
ncbi:MAG: protocatechuate 3,4-dioxygenase [Pseudomonadota bacterium]